jgi:hypothetical protein
MDVHVEKKMRLDDNLNQGTEHANNLYVNKANFYFLTLLAQRIQVIPTSRIARWRTKRLN